MKHAKFLIVVFCLMIFIVAEDARATLLWDGTFHGDEKRTGVNSISDPTGVYGYACLPQSDSFSVVSASTLPGGRSGYAAKFKIGPGSIYDCGGNQHSQILAKITSPLTGGSEYWYGWSEMVEYPWIHTGDIWVVGMSSVSTFYTVGGTGIGMAEVTSGKIEFDINKNYFYFPERQADKWTDWMYHVRWKQDNTGFAEVYRRNQGEANYQLVYSKYNFQTEYPFKPENQNIYQARIGLYRSSSITATHIVNILNPKIGTTRADVERDGSSSTPAPVSDPTPAPVSDPTPAPVSDPTPDTTSPIIKITCPITGSSYTSVTTSVSGTASDNVGVNKVRVKVGSSGVWQDAKGTTSWSISNLAGIVTGSNTIYAQAADAVGNTKETLITVTYNPSETLSTPSGTCTKTVAKDGSGGFTNIQAAANAAVAGDTICVKAGTYNEMVTIKNSGTAGKPITFKAEGAVTVTYPYSSMPSWSGLFWILSKNYITIDGFRLMGGYTCLHSDASSNIILKNNYCENPHAAGIKVGWGYSDNVVVANNVVNRFADPSTIEYNEMISISNAHNSEIRNNHVMKNTLGEAIVIKDKSSFIKVYNNLIEHSTLGIYAGGSGGAHDIEIYNNIAINNDQSQTKAGILLANERRLPPAEQKTPTNLNVHDNWASGQVMGIGVSFYAVTGTPVYGDVVFRNNKACGNKWRNYQLDPSMGFIIEGSLTNVNNIVPSTCTPPTWNPGSSGSGSFSNPSPFCTALTTLPTCSDNVLNQGEIDTDCGGPCPACPDTTPPVIEIKFPASSQSFITQTITFNGTASDDVALSKVQVRVNNGPWQPATGKDSWSSLVKLTLLGSNKLEVNATDTSGNSVIISVTVKYIDNILPLVEISLPTQRYTSTGQSITVKGTASDNFALDNVDVQVGGMWQSVSVSGASWSKSVQLVRGVNTIIVMANDTSGNLAKDAVDVIYMPSTCGNGIREPANEMCDTRGNIGCVAPTTICSYCNKCIALPQSPKPFASVNVSVQSAMRVGGQTETVINLENSFDEPDTYFLEFSSATDTSPELAYWSWFNGHRKDEQKTNTSITLGPKASGSVAIITFGGAVKTGNLKIKVTSSNNGTSLSFSKPISITYGEEGISTETPEPGWTGVLAIALISAILIIL